MSPSTIEAGTLRDARDDLAEARESLLRSTREYRASLDAVLEHDEGEVQRAAAQAAHRAELLARGLVSRHDVDEAERVRRGAEARRTATRARMVEADAILAETLAAIELAQLPPPAPDQITTTPALIHFSGRPEPRLVEIAEIERFFVSRFGRALPVSARGQTAIHDRLGLDHRHALDVAVHPDSAEGQALLAYLRSRRIPFLAFRQAVPAAATGAHVHIGTPSDRLPVPTSTRRETR